MAKHVVLIGGGHAHMMILAHLHEYRADGHRVTVIQPSEYHYYSGMGPGMLGGTYTVDEIRFATRKVVEEKGGIFLQDRAVRIHPERQIITLASGNEIPYDVLSCNVGSFVRQDMVQATDESIISVKPIEALALARERIITQLDQGLVRVAVVGGGPSAVEVAGNLRQLADEAGAATMQIQLFTGRRLLSRLPKRIQTMAEKILQRRRIEIIQGFYVDSIQKGQVCLQNGSTFTSDFTFIASGVHASTIFANSGMPVGPDGGMMVNQFLQCTGHKNIFGGGDCIHFAPQPLDKVGVYAVRQNPVLLHNLGAQLAGKPLQAFTPGGDYLRIYNLGGGQGILAKRSISFSGRLAFTIKDYIDRNFMRTFQALEQKEV